MASKTCSQAQVETKNSVVEHVFGIIDSKIQYLNYQTNELIRPMSSYGGRDEAKGNSPSLPSLEEQEKMFLLFEKQSKLKKLLLLLKMYLDEDNVWLIFELLSEDTLHCFDARDIEIILGVTPKLKAA